MHGNEQNMLGNAHPAVGEIICCLTDVPFAEAYPQSGVWIYGWACYQSNVCLSNSIIRQTPNQRVGWLQDLLTEQLDGPSGMAGWLTGQPCLQSIPWLHESPAIGLPISLIEWMLLWTNIFSPIKFRVYELHYDRARHVWRYGVGVEAVPGHSG